MDARKCDISPIFRILVFVVLATSEYISEVKLLPGHKRRNDYKTPVPYEYTSSSSLPKNFNWANVSGVNYLTRNLNQHVPQYCGSCWAHGALMTLADRIKIARKATGVEINLSIQYLLNCGMEVAGSCHGGSATGAFEFVKMKGFVPYETCQPYIACSTESNEGFCKHVDTTCSRENTCRTCSTFKAMGGKCQEIDFFPNATIAEYGEIAGEHKMMAEIFQRGPIACGIDAEPILDYSGGIFVDDNSKDRNINHIVSVTGWGETEGQKYWVVRNSWGEYWGEMGFMRLARGKSDLALEDLCSWATPGTWTETSNEPCYEDGDNCVKTVKYTDPFWALTNASFD